MLEIEKELIDYINHIDKNKLAIFPYIITFGSHINAGLGYDPSYPGYLFLLTNFAGGVMSTELLKLTNKYRYTYALLLSAFLNESYVYLHLIKNIRYTIPKFKKIKVL